MIETVRDPENMFKVGNTYINRIGEYRVLDISGTLMHVKYMTGERATLTTTVQARIITRIRHQQKVARQERPSATGDENTRRVRSPNGKAMAEAARQGDVADFLSR